MVDVGTVYETVLDVLSGKKSLKDIRKDLEKSAIQSLCAPPIKKERKSVVSTYDELNSTTAATTKSAVTALTYQLDSSIKGSGRQALDRPLDFISNPKPFELCGVGVKLSTGQFQPEPENWEARGN